MEIPRGNSWEEIKTRKQIIKDFYAKWISNHPQKMIWNDELKDYIHVKFQSINETVGRASGSYESTLAVLLLSDVLSKAKLNAVKARKQEDKNQKSFEKILVMRFGSIKLTVGKQRSTGEYVQYCITQTGAKK